MMHKSINLDTQTMLLEALQFNGYVFSILDGKTCTDNDFVDVPQVDFNSGSISNTGTKEKSRSGHSDWYLEHICEPNCLKKLINKKYNEISFFYLYLFSQIHEVKHGEKEIKLKMISFCCELKSLSLYVMNTKICEV